MKWARDVAWFLALGALLFFARRLIGQEGAEALPVLAVEADESVDDALLVDVAIRAGAVRDVVVRDRLERNLAFVGEGDVATALAMDMHRKDAITRRRLAEIGRAIVLSRMPEATPSEEELKRYAQAHFERYAAPAAARFEHELVAGESEAQVLPSSFTGLRSAHRIDATFGVGFAAEVMRAPIGHWTEIASSHGRHRVRVSERREARLPPLAAIRARVVHDWRHDQRPARLVEALAKLREHYDVRLETKR
jgi:hypothetical protein